ncbi:4510_t:CDS:2, partial [Scutellospora calospora]
MNLQEEWEMAEKNLARRKSLMLAHISVSSLTILIGICLLLILKYNASNKILNIVTSSITATGGVLALIKAIADKAADNIKKFTNTIKFNGKEKENIPALINMKDEELKNLKTERHENYIKFLTRINYLIRLEKKFGVCPVNISFPNIAQYADIGIIVSGTLWFINIILSHMIKLYDVVSNLHWGSADDRSTDDRRMGFNGRTYVLNKDVNEAYFGEYRTGNDDVTFFGTEIEAKLILRLALANAIIICGKINDDKETLLEILFKDVKGENPSKTSACKTYVFEIHKKEDKTEDKTDKVFEIYKNESEAEPYDTISIDNKVTIKIISKIESADNKSIDDKVKNKISNKESAGNKSCDEVSINDKAEITIKLNQGSKTFYNKEKPINKEFLKSAMKIAKDIIPNKFQLGNDDEAIEKFRTENDDEAMKLALKIMDKHCDFNLYLTKHNKKFFSFRKIYRFEVSRSELFKKLILRMETDNLIFKIEDIKLTKRHKREIRRLLFVFYAPRLRQNSRWTRLLQNY